MLDVEGDVRPQVRVDSELLARLVDVLEEPARTLHPSLRLRRTAERQRIEDELDREPRRQPVVAGLPGEAIAALVCVEGRLLLE
jgi:hypothetical protein